MTKETEPVAHTNTWTLAPSATFGSAVRAKGILQEIRSRLPLASRRMLEIKGMTLLLAMPEGASDEFRSAAALVTRSLADIEHLPVIPREIEDILTITTSERRRWLEDGRLPSAGTRTIKLRGRARRITFHIFDPAIVVDLLDRDAVDDWREDDIVAKVENRPRAAYQGKLRRSLKKVKEKMQRSNHMDKDAQNLRGWDDFDKDGLLR